MGDPTPTTDTPCPSHPEDGNHECMPSERRCVYCGVVLAVSNCNGCGKFLAASDLHNNESRCEECR